MSNKRIPYTAHPDPTFSSTLQGWSPEISDDKNVEQLRKLAADKLAELQHPEQALRYNDGKPKWSLVHFKSLEPMVRVLEYGCIKYAPYNWQKPMPLNEILNSMQRHLAALIDGETIDVESGISHMGHIQCNALFYNYHKGKESESKN